MCWQSDIKHVELFATIQCMYNNTFQKSWLWANQQLIKKNNKLLETQNFNIEGKTFSRKQNVSPDNFVPF